MRAIRVVLIVVGAGSGLYGVQLFLGLGVENLRATASWLLGGVVLHDAVLAPATIGLWFVAVRLLRGRLTAPVVLGAIVLGSVTLVAVPVLGRRAARPENMTLLDRPYVLGWIVLAALTLVIVTVAAMRDRRSRIGGDRGTGTRG